MKLLFYDIWTGDKSADQELETFLQKKKKQKQKSIPSGKLHEHFTNNFFVFFKNRYKVKPDECFSKVGHKLYFLVREKI